ncbi:hypothetical protein [Phyllobacterium phragmitis]|uniref:Autotransporter outer membrane beta-barrel domain-containing protein n=1 Tax=Phyllobacterium phragmitis TaxID=2670329 RepID=A0ABQ0H731_9HYPH
MNCKNLSVAPAHCLEKRFKKLLYSVSFIALTHMALNIPAAVAADINRWTGAASADWNDAGNWSLGHAPSANNNVIINSATLWPTISTAITNFQGPITVGGSNQSGELTINNGGSLMQSRKVLHIAGNAPGFGASVTLSGAGSKLISTTLGEVRVGAKDLEGFLSLGAGTAISGSQIFIGYENNATGRVTSPVPVRI